MSAMEKRKFTSRCPSGAERRIVERLQQRAGDDMGLLVAALPRPRMQRQLMLLGRAAVGGSIDDARLAERDIGKRRIARRLVIDMGAAKRRGERAVGDQRVMDGGAEGDVGGWHGGFLVVIDTVVPAKAGTHYHRCSYQDPLAPHAFQPR